MRATKTSILAAALCATVAAFAATCGSLVSNLIGAGKTDAVLPTIRQHIRLCYLFVLGLGVLVAVFPTRGLHLQGRHRPDRR